MKSQEKIRIMMLPGMNGVIFIDYYGDLELERSSISPLLKFWGEDYPYLKRGEIKPKKFPVPENSACQRFLRNYYSKI